MPTPIQDAVKKLVEIENLVKGLPNLQEIDDIIKLHYPKDSRLIMALRNWSTYKYPMAIEYPDGKKPPLQIEPSKPDTGGKVDSSTGSDKPDTSEASTQTTLTGIQIESSLKKLAELEKKDFSSKWQFSNEHNKKMLGRLTAAGRKIKELEQWKEHLEKVSDKLTDQVGELEKAVEGKDASAGQFLMAVRKLEKTLTLEDTEYEKALKSGVEKEEALLVLIGEIEKKLETKQGEAEKKLIGLESDIVRLEKKIEAKDKAFNELQAQKTELEKVLKDEEDKLAKMEKDMTVDKKTIEVQRSVVDNLRQERKEQDEIIAKANEDNKKLKNEKRAMDEKITRLNKALTEAEQKIEDLVEKDIKKLNEQLMNMNAEKSVMEKTISEKNNELVQMKNDVNVSQKEVEAKKNEIEALKKLQFNDNELKIIAKINQIVFDYTELGAEAFKSADNDEKYREVNEKFNKEIDELTNLWENKDEWALQELNQKKLEAEQKQKKEIPMESWETEEGVANNLLQLNQQIQIIEKEEKCPNLKRLDNSVPPRRTNPDDSKTEYSGTKRTYKIYIFEMLQNFREYNRQRFDVLKQKQWDNKIANDSIKKLKKDIENEKSLTQTSRELHEVAKREKADVERDLEERKASVEKLTTELTTVNSSLDTKIKEANALQAEKQQTEKEREDLRKQLQEANQAKATAEAQWNNQKTGFEQSLSSMGGQITALNAQVSQANAQKLTTDEANSIQWMQVAMGQINTALSSSNVSYLDSYQGYFNPSGVFSSTVAGGLTKYGRTYNAVLNLTNVWNQARTQINSRNALNTNLSSTIGSLSNQIQQKNNEINNMRTNYEGQISGLNSTIVNLRYYEIQYSILQNKLRDAESKSIDSKSKYKGLTITSNNRLSVDRINTWFRDNKLTSYISYVDIENNKYYRVTHYSCSGPTVVGIDLSGFKKSEIIFLNDYGYAEKLRNYVKYGEKLTERSYSF